MTAPVELAPRRAPRRTTRLRVALGVCALWLLLGLAWGAQTSMGSMLRPGDPVPLARALPAALLQSVPWIPVTLAAIALTVRLPPVGAGWRRRLPVHLGAAMALAFVANVLIVLGFWAGAGRFQGVATLARQGALWAVVNLHVALLVYAAVVAVTQGVLHYREARARQLQLATLEGQLARAHLQALTAQMRPHFLFNTLHTIGQLWRSGRSDDADAVLDQLGALFHRVQGVTQRLEVPLADELELVRGYLAIEQARFRDRLRATVCATPAAQACLVPPLILQPIVENAVKHGVSAVSTAGCVEVRADVVDGRLRLLVRDDGPGLHGAPSASVAPPRAGTGLRNTRERLAQRYGTAASLRLDVPPGGGTRATIELPAAYERAALSEAADD